VTGSAGAPLPSALQPQDVTSPAPAPVPAPSQPQPRNSRPTFFPPPDVIVQETLGNRPNADTQANLTNLKPEVPDDFIAVPEPRVDRATAERVRNVVEQANPQPPSQPSRNEVIPAPPQPRHKFHDVKRGETLWAIASKYSSNPGAFADAIYDANRSRMRSKNDIRAGVRLIIPTGGDAGAAPQRQASSPQNPEPRTPTYGSYTTRSGDTLSEIAQEFYGSAKHWRKLYELNKDRLKNPNVVPKGVELRVPKN